MPTQIFSCRHFTLCHNTYICWCMLLLYRSASDHCKVDVLVFCFKVRFKGVIQTETWIFWRCFANPKKSAVCKTGWYWSRRLNPLARATQNLAILISSTSAPLISPSPIDHRLTCATDVQNIQRCSNWNLIQMSVFAFQFSFHSSLFRWRGGQMIAKGY